MADKTEIAVSVMPKLETKIVELSSKLEQIMAERAPEAWDAALEVVQVNAAQDLVWAVFTMLVCVIPFYLCWQCVKRVPKEDNWMIGVIVTGVLSTVFLLTAGSQILNVWIYVAFAHPELAIAKRILDGVL